LTSSSPILEHTFEINKRLLLDQRVPPTDIKSSSQESTGRRCLCLHHLVRDRVSGTDHLEHTRSRKGLPRSPPDVRSHRGRRPTCRVRSAQAGQVDLRKAQRAQIGPCEVVQQYVDPLSREIRRTDPRQQARQHLREHWIEIAGENEDTSKDIGEVAG
jgi:hypothetical protein